MRPRQLPRTYYAFVLISACGPLLLLAGGGTLNRAGLAVYVFLVLGVGRGWRPAWALLLFSSSLSLAAVVALGAGGALVANAVLLAVYGACSVALLLSPSMLVHVRLRRRVTGTI
jgi:hypothetical protein